METGSHWVDSSDEHLTHILTPNDRYYDCLSPSFPVAMETQVVASSMLIIFIITA